MTDEERREYYREYRRLYRERNPDYVKKYNAKNREKIRAAQARYDASPKGQLANRRLHLKKTFGITLEQYDAMVRVQAGRCAICEGPPVGKGQRPSFAVDHDHVTGKIRALLCMPCNTMLGSAKDCADVLGRAILYLEQHRAD